MSEMEKKINALMRLATAEDSDAMAAAKAEIVELMKPAAKKDPGEFCVEAEVRRILTEIGMPEHIKGHRYNVEAIRLAVLDGTLIDAITGELYPAVAKVFGTTPSRVERAIRHAIEVAWARCDIDTLQEYFGCTISLTKGKLTNSEFIARISNMVRLRMKEAA